MFRLYPRWKLCRFKTFWRFKAAFLFFIHHPIDNIQGKTDQNSTH